MTDVRQIPPKSRPIRLDPVLSEGPWPFEKDLAGTLRCMASIETAIACTATRRSHPVEAELGLVGPRSFKAGKKSSGRIAKARSGKHVAEEATLRRLADAFPSVRAVMNSPLWLLARTGQIPHECGDFGYGTMNEAAYWAVRVPLPLIGAVRGSSWPVHSIQEDDLVRLVAQGSLDGVAALWMLLLEDSQFLGDPRQLLTIASYIPPAITLVSRTEVGLRISRILFARMRQLALDGLTANGYQLRLERYDIERIADTVTDWTPGVIGPPNPYKNMVRTQRVSVPLAIRDWVERSRAPLRKVRRRSARQKWRNNLEPSAHTDEVRAGFLCVMDKTAIEIFKEELREFW